MTKGWLENPYRTIYDYMNLDVLQGKTVQESIDDLRSKFGETDNEVGKARVNEVYELVQEFKNNGLLHNKGQFYQSVIMSKIKVFLELEYNTCTSQD